MRTSRRGAPLCARCRPGHRHLSPGRPTRLPGAHDQTGGAGRALPVPLPRLPGAGAMHARSSRPAARGLAAHGRGAKDAPAAGRAGGPKPVGAPGPNRGALLCADQATRRVPALDGVGAGGGPDPVGAAPHGGQPAHPLPALASRAQKRGGNAPSGQPWGRRGRPGGLWVRQAPVVGTTVAPQPALLPRISTADRSHARPSRKPKRFETVSAAPP